MDRNRIAERTPPEVFLVVSAIFHYLGPAFAVLLFARVSVLGVAWLRIVTAAVVFSLWRRPWRSFMGADRSGRVLLIWWGVVLAFMNCTFYLAIARLPLGTVAAIEFLPVIALAALGFRSQRNLAALGLAVAGVALLTDVRLIAAPAGFVFAFANAGFFAAYIVIGHRAAQSGAAVGIGGLASAMLIAAIAVTPMTISAAAPALVDPVALLAGAGVGVASSVIPYVADQLAMARVSRATYALLFSLLPATATLIGVVVLHQLPTTVELVGVMLVVGAIAMRRE